MKITLIVIVSFFLMIFFACEQSESKYDCGTGVCFESENGAFTSLEECLSECGVVVTVFIFENCPIAQYMCGPLRNSYRYFCDTLDQNFIFRGFSPNAISDIESLASFQTTYDIPFELEIDYNHKTGEPGLYTQFYQPLVTPEVFVEHNGELIYRGMIDNSYLGLGNWSNPTEHYLFDALTSIVNLETITYSETVPIGCLINY